MLEDEPLAEDIVHVRQKNLQRRVLLLAPTFGCWRGMYQLSEDRVDVKLDNQTVRSEDVTTPRAILMKDTCPVDRNGTAWKKRFRDIEKQHQKLIDEFSVPFPIHGCRIIPKAKGREFFDRLIGPTTDSGHPVGKRDGRLLLGIEKQAIAYQLAKAADEFCSELTSVFAQIATDNPKVWAEVQDRVPATLVDMREKFYVDAVPIELAGGEFSEVTQEDLADHSAIVREACHRKVNEAIESMVREPREQLAKALASLHELISRDGRVTERSFGPVRAAIAKIRLFDFVANDELLQQINAMEARLEITKAAELDSVTAANNGFSTALQALRTEITSAEQQAADLARFGRPMRSILVD